MYQRGERVLYAVHGICRVVDLEERVIDRKTREYYVLEPDAQPGTRYYVPISNPVAVAKMRPLITRQELMALLRSDSIRQDVWIEDENLRKQHYRELLSGTDRCALICMVRTLRRHKQEQSAQGRKFHQCDENFLKDACKLLDSEFSRVLTPEDRERSPHVLEILGE